MQTLSFSGRQNISTRCFVKFHKINPQVTVQVQNWGHSILYVPFLHQRQATPHQQWAPIGRRVTKPGHVTRWPILETGSSGVTAFVWEAYRCDGVWIQEELCCQTAGLGGYSCECIQREDKERGDGRTRGRKRRRERSRSVFLCVSTRRP